MLSPLHLGARASQYMPDRIVAVVAASAAPAIVALRRSAANDVPNARLAWRSHRYGIGNAAASSMKRLIELSPPAQYGLAIDSLPGVTGRCPATTSSVVYNSVPLRRPPLPRLDS